MKLTIRSSEVDGHCEVELSPVLTLRKHISISISHVLEAVEQPRATLKAHHMYRITGLLY